MSETDAWVIAALRAEVAELRAQLASGRPRHERYDPDPDPERTVPPPKN